MVKPRTSRERLYHQSYYQRNKDKYLARAKVNGKVQQERIREIIRQAKGVPCADCGVQYPFYVMQFDHLGAKEFTIGSYSRTGGVARLQREIAKCEVVCANCHAERTHQRYQARRAMEPSLPPEPPEEELTLF